MCLMKHQLVPIADNIDTRSALEAIRDLVTNSNVYIKDSQNPNTLLLRDIAVYMTKIFTIFGAISGSHNDIGLPVASENENFNVINSFFLFLLKFKFYYLFINLSFINCLSIY